MRPRLQKPGQVFTYRLPHGWPGRPLVLFKFGLLFLEPAVLRFWENRGINEVKGHERVNEKITPITREVKVSFDGIDTVEFQAPARVRRSKLSMRSL